MTQERLFAAIKQGTFASVKQLIADGQDINTRDNEGLTPLLKAIEAQGHDIVQFLLENNADPNIADRSGRSAYHHAVKTGVRGILQILLQHRCTVDLQDKYGQTALHYAIQRNWVQVADWLVFFGADVKLCDKLGNSAVSLARDSGSRMTEAVNQNLEPERPTECRLAGHLEEIKLKNLTIKFVSEQDFTSTSTFLLYKSCDSSVFLDRPQMKLDEEIWGEVVECRLSQANIQMNLMFYLQGNPGFTEIFVKYKSDGKEEKEAVATITCLPDQSWRAVAKINLAARGWFLVCNRPKNEEVAIPKDGGKIVSTLDENFLIDLPKNAFETDGKLVIKVEDSPAVTSSMKNVITMSRFYDIEHNSGAQPSKDIRVTLPLPAGYTGTGDLYVLSRSGGAVVNNLEEEERCWTVLDAGIHVDGRCASFTTKHFSVKCIQEGRKGSTKNQLKAAASKSYRNRKRHVVKFFVCGKHFARDTHDVIVECCQDTNLEKRLEAWNKEQYSCMRVSGCHWTRTRNEFGMAIRGNIESVDDISTLMLVYSPSNLAFQHLELRVPKKAEIHSGKIAIKDLKKPKKDVLTYLPFELDEKAYTAHSEEVHQEALKERGMDAAFSDDEPCPTGKYIAAELTQLLSVEDVWWKLWLLFGFNRQKLVSDPSGGCQQMLPKWFSLNGKKEDFGISKLVRVLVMVGKTCAAQDVVNYLRSCSNSPDCMKEWEGKPFWKWLTSRKDFTLQAIAAEREIPEPMTDVFLLEISKHLGTETHSLFLLLGLTSSQLEIIKSDIGHAGHEFVTFMMLVKVRDQSSHPPGVLMSLLKSLVEVEQNVVKELVLALTEEWTTRFPDHSKARGYKRVIASFQ